MRARGVAAGMCRAVWGCKNERRRKRRRRVKEREERRVLALDTTYTGTKVETSTPAHTVDHLSWTALTRNSNTPIDIQFLRELGNCN